MTIYKHKICMNCGAVMTWNPILNRWECKICGNAEELSANFEINRFEHIR